MAVLAFAAGVIFFRLGSPHALMFDEVYYARDARSYRLGASENQGIDACNRRTHPAAICSWVHPPLGKILISLGERTGPARCPSPTKDSGGRDCSPWQWRVSSAVAGLLTVALVILLARLLLGSWVWASAAGLLLTLDGLFLVQARIAMLDAFLELFVVAGALLVVWDHMDRKGDSVTPPAPPSSTWETSIQVGGRHSRPSRDRRHVAFAWPARHAGDEPGSGAHAPNRLSPPTQPPPASGQEVGAERPARGRSPFHWRRFAAGACFGAGAAVKWTGALALVAAWLLVLGWALVAKQRARRALAGGAALPVDTPGPLDGLAWLGALVVVPVAVYALAWVPYMFEHAWRFHDLAELHKAVWHYHQTLTAEHPYKSPAWQWPLLWRPVAYYFEQVGGDRAEVLALGNPVLWWVSLPAVLGVGAVLALPGPRRRAGPAPAVVAAFYGMLYLPWLVVSRPQFLFYMTPVVPFMALAVAYWASRLWPARTPDPVPGAGLWRAAVIAVFGGVLIAFAAFYPVWTAVPIPFEWWRHLLVFRSWI